MTGSECSNLILKSCIMTSCICNFQEEAVWRSLFTLRNIQFLTFSRHRFVSLMVLNNKANTVSIFHLNIIALF